MIDFFIYLIIHTITAAKGLTGRNGWIMHGSVVELIKVHTDMWNLDSLGYLI